MASTADESSAAQTPVYTQTPVSSRIFSLFERTSFPDSDFKLSLLDYAKDETLREQKLIEAILEEFSTLTALFGDPSLVKKTLGLLRDLLIERGCFVERGRGVLIAKAVAKVLYSEDQFTPEVEALLLNSPDTAHQIQPVIHENNNRHASSTTNIGLLETGRLAFNISQRFLEESKYDGGLDVSILEYFAKYHSASRDFELTPEQKLR